MFAVRREGRKGEGLLGNIGEGNMWALDRKSGNGCSIFGSEISVLSGLERVTSPLRASVSLF